MEKMIWLCVFGGLCLSGCFLKTEPAPNADVNALRQRFHGKYEVVSATSSEPIDLNMDGTASIDMVQEYAYLKQYHLELHIYGPNKYSDDRAFLFTQWWPEQYIDIKPGELPVGQDWAGEPITYDANRIVNYASQGSTRSFEFSPDLKTIWVKPNQTENLFRWVAPQSTTIDGSDYIRTVNKRRLYTRYGVKDVEIITLYKRYTTIT